MTLSVDTAPNTETSEAQQTPLGVVLVGQGDPESIKQCLIALMQHGEGLQPSDVAVVLPGAASLYRSQLAALDDTLNIFTTAPQQSIDDAWSLGIEKMASRWLLLISDDIRVQAGWLDRLATYVSENPECLSVTPTVMSSTGAAPATSLAPTSGRGVCMMLDRQHLVAGGITGLTHVEDALVISEAPAVAQTALTVTPPSAHQAAAQHPAPSQPAAPAPAPAPGGGAPAGPVRVIGNAVHAGSDFEESKKRLHLGCGPNQILGWLNVDGDPACHPNMVIDLRNGIDLPSGSVERIYSEHFFEHFTLPQAIFLLGECHRVLAPGGIIRTAMPDLKATVLAYLGRWRDQEWLRDQPQIDTAAHMLNVGLREWGHLYVYDEEDLSLRLHTLGFVDITPERIGQSRHADLRDLETRPESSLIIEASKAR